MLRRFLQKELTISVFQVGWVKADTKAIQAIHEHVITHNPRVSVSHSDHSTWYLHIKNVQEEDRGQYMCQINTDPMKSQVRINFIGLQVCFFAYHHTQNSKSKCIVAPYYLLAHDNSY